MAYPRSEAATWQSHIVLDPYTGLRGKGEGGSIRRSEYVDC